MKRIIALDPGGTTGWALYEEVGNQFVTGQIGPQEHHEDLFELLSKYQVDDYRVICESFEFRKFDGHREGINLISREYIGVAKLFVQQRMFDSGRPVVLQTPGAAKGFIPDRAVSGMEANAKLKVLGLYEPGKKHAMDAMRHLLYYLVNVEHKQSLISPWRNL